MISALSALIAGEIKLKDKVAPGAVTPPLSVGEVVEATVSGKQGGKLTIMVKGMPLEATSSVPLGEGQKITVRISQLFPRIVMIPMNAGEAPEGAQPLLAHIRNFKQDPAMLKNIFSMGKDILTPANIAKYQEMMPATNFGAIRERLDSLLFAKDTLGEYAGKLGLMHEHAIASGRGESDNLKAMMIRLQEDIAKVVSEKGASSKELTVLSEYAASSVSGIESFQAVNLLSMDKDALFFLPLLFQFNNEIRTGDFFASQKETVQGKELRAVVFLDMDNLGKVMAEARLAGGSVKCSFRCEDPETRDFLSARATLLKDGLDALGYKTSDINCYHERNMDAARMEVLEEFPAYSEGVLNIKA